MKPDFSGIWEADLSKSKLLGQVPDRIQVTIEHDDPRIVQTVTSTKGGNQEVVTFRFTTDGEDSVLAVRKSIGKTRAGWSGAELAIKSSIALGGRDFSFCDYWSLSADGLLLTMEHRDDDLAGQVTFLNRVSGVV